MKKFFKTLLKPYLIAIDAILETTGLKNKGKT